MLQKLLGYILLAGTSAFGQGTGLDTPEGPAAAVARAGSARDYRLGAGDLLEIKVFGVDALCQTVRVSSEGTVSLPLLGQVEAAGFTRQELEERVASRLSEQRLVRDPQVTVFITEYRSQPVYVLGAVNKPGQYMISGQLRLIDAITIAGGLDPMRFGDTILVKRQVSSDGGPQSVLAPPAGEGANVESIPVKGLLEKADLSQNILLRAGDIVQVQERKSEVFYVVGDVNKPGAFEFPRDQEGVLRVSQAIVWAGGPTRTAKMKKGMLVRYAANTERQQMGVDFQAILRGKKPDLPVRPNDIIYIPGSTAKTLTYALAQAVPWALANAVIFGLP